MPLTLNPSPLRRNRTFRSILATCFVAACFYLNGPDTSAQTPTAADRILTAAAANSLNDIQDRPWHLKMDVTIYDDAGVNPQAGTVETWRAGKNSRTVYTFGGVTGTRMTVDGTTYHSVPWPEIPYRGTQSLEEVLSPGPSPNEVAESTPELRKQSIGKTSLDCVMLSQPIKGGSMVHLGLFPTYCIEPGSGVIVAAYDFGGELTTIQKSGTFLEHKVPIKFTILEGKATVVTAAVTTLTTFQPGPDDFVPAANMKSGNGGARIAGGVLAGNIVRKVPPIYPEVAKMNHASGTVVLHAIIGRDGHVHNLRPISSPDPDLSLAAIIAVRQWTYKPYLLNGEPTDVDSTITVNFNLN